MARLRYHLTDETHSSLRALVRLRLPWLVLGLMGGLLASYLVSEYKSILERDISLAFFVPIIVYMSDAVGTQTESIYIGNKLRFKVRFLKYLTKELFVGLILGIVLGVAVFATSWLWLKNWQLSLTVGGAMFANITLSPLIALVISALLEKLHDDPALGAGPFATVIQDFISLLIYFSVATLIIGRY